MARCPSGRPLGWLLGPPPGTEVSTVELLPHQVWKQSTYHIISVFPFHLGEVNTTIVRFPSLFPFFILAGEETYKGDKEIKHFNEITSRGHLYPPRSCFEDGDYEQREISERPSWVAVLQIVTAGKLKPDACKYLLWARRIYSQLFAWEEFT